MISGSIFMDVLKVQDLEAPKGTKKQGYLNISEKPAGPHRIPVTLVNGSGDGPTLVVNGGEHGSEYNGPAATLTVMKELDPATVNGKVIIVPMVNQEGLRVASLRNTPEQACRSGVLPDSRYTNTLSMPLARQSITTRGSRAAWIASVVPKGPAES